MLSFDVCIRLRLPIPTFFLLLFVTHTNPLIMTSRCVLANRSPGIPEVQRMRDHGCARTPEELSRACCQFRPKYLFQIQSRFPSFFGRLLLLFFVERTVKFPQGHPARLTT
ncbi:hypothetical protein BJY00DRAFT_247878 [Aspergillus carlsbadensis]|nr:hypothetical protein BJY00DRAFT_247878 [Aspergillus carlsbadensis]